MVLVIEGGVLKGFTTNTNELNIQNADVSMIYFNAFGYKNITKINFTGASNLEEIGQHAFVGNPIEELVIPSSIKKIDQHAFGNCRDLTEITFAPREAGAPVAGEPVADVELGIGAFAGCSSLEKIIINSHLKIKHLSFEDRKNLAAFPYTMDDRDPVKEISVEITKAFTDNTNAQDYVRNCALFYEFKKCEVTFEVAAQKKLMTKNRKYPNFSNPREKGSAFETTGGGRIHRNIKSNSIKSKMSKKKKYKAKITQKNRITP